MNCAPLTGARSASANNAARTGELVCSTTPPMWVSSKSSTCPIWPLASGASSRPSLSLRPNTVAAGLPEVSCSTPSKVVMVRWPEPASAQPIQSSTPRRASRFAAADRSPNCAAARWPHSVLVKVTASVLRFWSMLLLGFDSGVADDFGPSFHVSFDLCVHLIRRAADRLITLDPELLDHLGQLQRPIGLNVEPVDHGLGRAGRRRESVPRADLEAGNAT